jgi:ribonuclease T2
MKDLPKNVFTMHGLWPSYSSGQQIGDCNKGADVKIVEDQSDLFLEMDTKWPSYTSGNTKFWGHEYNKHGFCYTSKYKTQDYKEYFRFALNVFKKHSLDMLMKKAFGDLTGEHSFTVQDLIGHLQAVLGDLVFELDCKPVSGGHQHIQEVRFFFDLDLKPTTNYPRRTDCKDNKPIFVQFS